MPYHGEPWEGALLVTRRLFLRGTYAHTQVYTQTRRVGLLCCSDNPAQPATAPEPCRETAVPQAKPDIKPPRRRRRGTNPRPQRQCLSWTSTPLLATRPLTSSRPMSHLRPREDKVYLSLHTSPFQISCVPTCAFTPPPPPPRRNQLPRGGGIAATKTIDGRNPPALARQGPSPSRYEGFWLCLHDTPLRRGRIFATGEDGGKRLLARLSVSRSQTSTPDTHTYTYIHMQVGSCSCCTRQWSPLVSIHRAPSFFDCYVRP